MFSMFRKFQFVFLLLMLTFCKGSKEEHSSSSDAATVGGQDISAEQLEKQELYLFEEPASIEDVEKELGPLTRKKIKVKKGSRLAAFADENGEVTIGTPQQGAGLQLNLGKSVGGVVGDTVDGVSTSKWGKLKNAVEVTNRFKKPESMEAPSVNSKNLGETGAPGGVTRSLSPAELLEARKTGVSPLKAEVLPSKFQKAGKKVIAANKGVDGFVNSLKGWKKVKYKWKRFSKATKISVVIAGAVVVAGFAVFATVTGIVVEGLFADDDNDDNGETKIFNETDSVYLKVQTRISYSDFKTLIIDPLQSGSYKKLGLQVTCGPPPVLDSTSLSLADPKGVPGLDGLDGLGDLLPKVSVVPIPSDFDGSLTSADVSRGSAYYKFEGLKCPEESIFITSFVLKNVSNYSTKHANGLFRIAAFEDSGKQDSGSFGGIDSASGGGKLGLEGSEQISYPTMVPVIKLVSKLQTFSAKGMASFSCENDSVANMLAKQTNTNLVVFDVSFLDHDGSISATFAIDDPTNPEATNESPVCAGTDSFVMDVSTDAFKLFHEQKSGSWDLIIEPQTPSSDFAKWYRVEGKLSDFIGQDRILNDITEGSKGFVEGCGLSFDEIRGQPLNGIYVTGFIGQGDGSYDLQLVGSSAANNALDGCTSINIKALNWDWMILNERQNYVGESEYFLRAGN